MILLFSIGDRVKLTDRYARVLDNSRGGVRGRWLNRRGTVTYCNNTEVVIKWDGRNTKDRVPHKGVEFIHSAPKL